MRPASATTAILLVDDHEENLLALEAILEPTGYRLVRARSGDEALKALLRDEFAAILLDVQMPGIDGFETAQLIRARERTRTVPIIFVTAISKTPEHVFRGYDAGAVDYLFKPVDPLILRSKVEVFGALYERGRALAEREEQLRVTFEDAPIGMARADPDGRIRHVNRALEETIGRGAAELVGRTLDELGPRADVGIDADRREQLMSGAIRHYEHERRLSGPRGTTIPVLVSASLARPSNGGRPDLILQLQDLRERRRAQRDREQLIRTQAAHAQAEAAAERLQVMHTIATAVLGAVGLEELLRELLDRILEALDVDRATAVLTDEGRPVIARAARGVETLVDRDTRETVVDGIVERVVHERATVTIADVPADGVDARSLGGAITSVLAVPLFDAGRIIGSIQVGTLTRRDFDAETIGLLRLAADRAGLAIGRTRLYERERRIAQELQRSLLPKRLPDVAGVGLGARYEPGENGTAVGGDWYDAIALPSGRVALAIGDVVGRGIEAAATMGQMRSALRAILMQADDTGRMADRLNRFTIALGSDEAIMTTVVLAILEPGTGTLRFTNAGHPPPLLVGPDGRAAYLDEPPAPPMGVLATPRYKQHTRRLLPGATLVLYTDGLVEEPTEVLDVGLERLREAARGSGTDVDATCELLLDSLRDDTARSDDVTLLVVRLQETLGERVTLEVSNESGGLFMMRQTLRRWLVEHGADADETEDVIMACNEACENSIEHGYDLGDDLFGVEFSYDGGEIAISVRDYGTWREPQETRDRGRGLPLMRKLMDAVEVRPRPAGTTVRMSRRLAAGRRADQATASSRSRSSG